MREGSTIARFGDLNAQYFDDAGDPLISGKVYFYETGTTTLKATYADVDYTIANTNPVILTAAGRQPNIFFEGVAKAILATSAGTQILVRDPVGDTAESFGNPWISSKRYSANDVVQGSDGQYYVSLINGNINLNPVTTTGNWTFLYSIEWSAGTTYKEGSVITYQTLLYQSLQSTNLNKNPVTETAYWVIINLAYVSTVTYTVGQNVVGPDGVFYTALRTTIGDTPASSPSDWVGTSAAAAASASAALASQVAAAASASTATTQASNASTSASTATTQAGLASTSASTATTQAGIATTQAGIATTQAGIATTQASNAAASAVSADASAVAAAASAASIGTTTGTGSIVRQTSPTLIAPILGTPSSGTVTNLTGTASININGTVGATTPGTGAFTTLSARGLVTANAGNTADQAVFGNTYKVYINDGSLGTYAGITDTAGGAGRGMLIANNTVYMRAGSTPGTAMEWTGVLSRSNAPFYVADSTQSTSTTTGSVRALGGLGVVKDTFLGGTLAITGAITNTAGTANGVTYLNASKVLTSGSGLQFDGTHLGVGGAPTAWGGSIVTVQANRAAFAGNAGAEAYMTSNVYYDGAVNRYTSTGYHALQYLQAAAGHVWNTAPVNGGAAGAVATMTERMNLSSTGLAVTGTLSASGTVTLTGTSTTLGDVGSIGQDANSVYIGTNFTGTGGNFRKTGNYAQQIFMNSIGGEISIKNTSAAGTAGSPITFDVVPVRITAAGLVGINAIPVKTFDVGGEIRASGGILFGSDTAAANALDDYEEGSWTPAVRGDGTAGTYETTNAYGFYTKIGNMVTVSYDLLLAGAVTGGGTGDATIINLPFTSSATTGMTARAAVGVYTVDFSAGYTYITAGLSGLSSTTIYMLQSGDNQGLLFLPISAIVAGSRLISTMTYFV